MKEDFEKQLESDFPFMQQNRDGEGRNTYSMWGCECGSGWYDLIHELCQRISNRYETDEKAVDIVVLQVKQKFATLRFYYEYEDAPCPIQAFDFIGNGSSLRFTPNTTTDEATQKLRKDISEIVRNCEKNSGTVCEICGSKGQIRKVTPYYVRTLCEDCYNDHLLKIENKKQERKEKRLSDYLD